VQKRLNRLSASSWGQILLDAKNLVLERSPYPPEEGLLLMSGDVAFRQITLGTCHYCVHTECHQSSMLLMEVDWMRQRRRLFTTNLR